MLNGFCLLLTERKGMAALIFVQGISQANARRRLLHEHDGTIKIPKKSGVQNCKLLIPQAATRFVVR